MSVAAAVRRAIASREARRTGVITPYVESLHRKIRASLEEDGLEVAGIDGMGIAENLEIGAVRPDLIAAFAFDHFDAGGVDRLSPGEGREGRANVTAAGSGGSSATIARGTRLRADPA